MSNSKYEPYKDNKINYSLNLTSNQEWKALEKTLKFPQTAYFQMVVLNKSASFIKRWRTEWNLFILKQEKTLIVKKIKYNKLKERYQADTVLLPNCVWNEFKYFFKMIDHFTKYDG